MPVFLRIGIILGVFATGQYAAVKTVDSLALHARAGASVSRRELCETLLNQADWRPGPIGDRASVEMVPAVDATLALRYVGARREIDAPTAELLAQIQARTVEHQQLVGEYRIRKVLHLVHDPAAMIRGGGIKPVFISTRETFEEYQTSRLAIELESFDQILADYGAGRNRDVTAFAITAYPAAPGLSKFAFDTVKDGIFGRTTEQRYFWHQLSWDAVRQAPVWRFGYAIL